MSTDQNSPSTSLPAVVWRVVCERHNHAPYLLDEREAFWLAQSFDRTHGTPIERCPSVDHFVERAEWRSLPRRCAANAGRCEYPPSSGTDLCPQHAAETAANASYEAGT